MMKNSPRPRNPKAATPADSVLKKLDEVDCRGPRAARTYPVEIIATTEHRLGLKPVLSSVWAPKGEAPVAGRWLQTGCIVTALTQPLSGEAG